MYELNWDDKVESFFIKRLSWQVLVGNYKYGQCILQSLAYVQTELQKEFKLFFSLRHLKRHVASLESRYTVFNWLVHQPAVCFDSVNNTCAALPEVWDSLAKVCH